MSTTKLTVRLPRKDLEFAKRSALHPEVEKISGLVPADLDAEALYGEHLMSKHR